MEALLWCCSRERNGWSVADTDPSTATSEAAVARLGQPAGVEPGLVLELHDGQRLQQRGGVDVGIAEVPRGAAVLALRGDQPDTEAALRQVHGDRRRR